MVHRDMMGLGGPRIELGKASGSVLKRRKTEADPDTEKFATDKTRINQYTTLNLESRG